MIKQIGLWIDHKRAVILTLYGRDESLNVVESGIERQTSIRGAIRSRMPYSAQYPKGDDRLDNRFDEQLKKYYEKVLAQFHSADVVWIFGPGEAKAELKRHLELRKNRIRVDGVESADKMTNRQITAKIRHHFQTADTNT